MFTMTGYDVYLEFETENLLHVCCYLSDIAEITAFNRCVEGAGQYTVYMKSGNTYEVDAKIGEELILVKSRKKNKIPE